MSRLSSLMIVGGQWGDEGKGKMVDLLSAGFKAVVRYNGGHNAGHTVRFENRRFALHLVPSGIIHDEVICYLASGMVIHPTALVEELEMLEREGVQLGRRVRLSPRATLILPTHCALDRAREGARGTNKIGTTGRGIGPAYQDLAQRRALRAYLLADRARLRDAARAVMEQHNHELTTLFEVEPVDLDAALDELDTAATRLGPTLEDVGAAITAHMRQGEPLLFEGAQGVLLDILHGTYPYVTSSSCLPGFGAASSGVSPKAMGPVLGIMKAYVTRVGSGPFPSELEDAEGERLRDRGQEYGTTTGRPRRCGWFDAVAARYAIEVAGIDALAIMKLDILDGFDRVKVVVGYELPDGTTLNRLPADPDLLAQVRPRHQELQGWPTPVEGLTDAAALPDLAEAYLRHLEHLLGIPIVIVSTGPRRNETLIRGNTTLAQSLRPMVTPTL